MTPGPPIRTWPVWLLGAPAGVAIWSGWVGLGQMTGFGKINPLPGTPLASWELDTAITLPVGMEVYAAYALWVWLSGRAHDRAEQFARSSAIGALCLGAAGQVAYHLMAAAQWDTAPWWITTLVACVPVAVLALGATLRHLIHATPAAPEPASASSPASSSPAPGEAKTADPGDGERPSQGRRTTPAAAGRVTPGKASPPAAAGPARDEVAAAYVRAALDTGRKPSREGLVKAVRAAGYGIGTKPADDLLKRLMQPHAVREVASA